MFPSDPARPTTFHVVADGGVRLWVNGQLLADDWGDVPRIPGDANLDGVVDHDDFRIVYTFMGQAGGWEQGDFDGNGTVGFGDYQTLEANAYQMARPKTYPLATPLRLGWYREDGKFVLVSHERPPSGVELLIDFDLKSRGTSKF